MEFRILGPLEAVDEGRPVELPRRLSRALLAYLLLHANEPVSSDRLIDELWGAGAPKTATASLQNYVSRLRKALGAETIQLEPAGYVLRVDPERFDLARFDRLVEEAQGAPAKQRAELLRAALSLWRGGPLEDLAFEEFAQEEIALLAERRLAAIEARIEADLELGRGAELVDELEALIAEHPLRERLRAQLMIALYRAGRQGDALAAYRDARRALDVELGLEPSEELRVLERKILEQDPALSGAGAVRAAPMESRRVVTVLFCDVVDSTRLATRLDPEAYRRVMSAYFDAARGAIKAHGGLVEKFIGDAVMALFGVPERHEDDALRAVRAAVDARAAVAAVNADLLRDWNVELAVRIATNTGEVMTSTADPATQVTGAPINIAAHMEKRAGANEIVLGEETHRLVRDATRAEHVDLGDDLYGWRLDEVLAEPPAVALPLEAPLVGRKKELRRLRNAFQRARKEQECVVATIVGEAGIGKTRLGRALVTSLGDEARVLVGRCVSYGAGATFLPVAEIVKRAAPEASVEGIAALLSGEEDAEQVAQRVAELIGIAEGPAAPGESFWAVRRLLEALARQQPLLVAFDDIHWGEPTLLDLIEYLGEWAEGPIMVLCLARADLLDKRPGWGGPTSTGFLVDVEPLSAEDVGSLLEQIAAGPVAPDVQAKITERAGGNALFAQQLLALAAEAPDVSLDEAPPTVEALIASRLDRLESGERDVLQRASVIGRHFTRADVKDLGPLNDADLASLERRALVHSIEDRFAFHHVLVRDVAYRGIPKAGRAELHERAADSLAHRDATDELVGFHLEQAYTYRTELGRIDDRGRRIARAAGERLDRAGIRAWKRADAPAAVNLMARATHLLPRDEPRRRELLCELGIAARVAGHQDEFERFLDEAATSSLEAGDRRLELRAGIELEHARMYEDATAADRTFDLATSAISTFEAAGDERSLGRAWLAIATVLMNFKLQNARAEEAAERAISYYQRGGWSPSTSLGVLTDALHWGPRPVEEAIDRCEQLLREHAGDRASEANVYSSLGLLEGMRGRFDTGLAHIDVTRAMYDELGLVSSVESSGRMRAYVETFAGRLEDAEQHLRESCEASIRRNEASYVSSQAAELADVLYRLARYEEAQTWAQTARDHAGEGDLHAQVFWRAIEARLAARRGEFELGESLAKAAVAIMEQTDAVSQHAKVLLDLAEVLRIAGNEAGARAAVKKAEELYRAKGNVAALEAARNLLTSDALV
jgi:DNA-binding SARP family transcriptional activator/tetratricopeptide (TPR) repeat protein